MKSQQTIALAGLTLCSLLAVMLSCNLMATLQNQPIAGGNNQPLSEVAYAASRAQNFDTFAPELPPLVLSPAALPLNRALPSTAEHLPAVEANNSTGELSNPTTSHFRPLSPQFGSQPRGQMGAGGVNRPTRGDRFIPRPGSGGSNNVPPVGIDPPQVGNVNRGNFSGAQNRSFETERGSFDSSSDSALGPSEEGYYDRNRAGSFAPPGSNNDQPASQGENQFGEGFEDIDPELMRSESAYNARSNGQASGRSGGSTDPSTIIHSAIGQQAPLLRGVPIGSSSLGNGTFFPALPGTAIGMGSSGTGLGGRKLGHPGTCGCDRCSAVTGQTCKTCCQPLCVTKTILVPELYTIFRTVNETHYRPQIKEVPFFREETVTHRVPVIEKFPVIVKEPRIRNFKTYRKEEYQTPREVSYTVMVPKPKTRQVTSERVETFEVPEEEQYTVMVRKEKEVRKTKHKIVKDKEAIFKEYVVMVPQQRKRIMIDYQTQKKEFIRKVPYTVMVERELQRNVISYRNEIVEVKTEEEYYEYVKQTGTWKSPRIKPEKSFIPGKEEFLQYREIEDAIEENYVVQERRKGEIEQTYTVTVPYKEEVEEVFWENEPYTEMVSRPSATKTLKSRDVVKPYRVKIPYVEHVPQMYSINIPYESKAAKNRVIPQQIPVTKYQTVKRDTGRWVTDTVSVDTLEIGNDRCGCPTCCPKARTITQTRWVPNVVTQSLPYTTFKTVKKRVTYEAPEIKYRREPRQRMLPVTKFRTEVRERVEKVYTYETSTKPASFPVTKFRMVRKTRPKTVTVYREEKRTRNVPINRYVKTEETRRIPFKVKQVEPKVRDIRLPTLIEKRFEVDEEYTFTQPIPKKRTIIKKITVRKPYEDVETFVVKVPQIRYKEVAEIEEYDVEVPREVTYTVEVPEVRIRKEFIEVERKVPYVETSKLVEMVPEVKTRRVYKSRERTVSDIRTETFMTSEPEVVTKTVYDTKYRDVPVFQSELYWEDVTKILKRTVFKEVTRKVKRPAMKKYKVNVPYLVQVRVPKTATRMVPRQITIPIEVCCEDCCTEFTDLTDACGSYIQYGIRSVRSWVNGM